MTEPAKFYKNNFATLKSIAEALRPPNEVDIDEMIPMADKAIEAYKNCKDRLSSVTKQFEEKMSFNKESSS